MFGDMGCGKSATASYVTYYLKQGLSETKTPVIAFYCKEQETPNLRVIYRSLVYQLVQMRPELMAQLQAWYNESRTGTQLKPSDDVVILAGILRKSVHSLRSSVFIILDGLDECERPHRRALLELFRDLIQDGALMKLFLSSREREDIHSTLSMHNVISKKALPVFHIYMKPTEDRDRILAEHLASRWLEGEDIQEAAANQLFKLAKGSAIWLQIALNGLREARVRNEYGMRKRLEALKTSPSLVTLYKDLFDSPDVQANKMTVQKALETLAVARRPLTVGELSYATFIDECGPNLPELDQAAESVDLMTLVRPFVSTTIVGTGQRVGLRLVHQSLLELVLMAPPIQWKALLDESSDFQQNDKGREQRRARLESAMLRRCVGYLLFEEFQTKKLSLALPTELFGIETDDDPLMGMNLSDVDDEVNNKNEDVVSTEVTSELNPEELGFGKFFAYAAAYWTEHIIATPLALKPKADDLVDLCGKGTRCLENWIEMWKRPTCSFFEERTFLEDGERDPLMVMAYIDPEPAFLGRVAEAAKDTPERFLEYPELAVLRFLGRHNLYAEILGVLNDPGIGPTSCSPWFFIEAFQYWQVVNPTSWNECEEIFGFVIRRLGHRLIETVHTTLRLACMKGCLVLVKLLFQAGAEIPDLRNQMLSVQEPRKSFSPRLAHQSVGEAAAWGHHEIVRFLCEQDGIQAHLQWINSFGKTVFHQATHMTNTSYDMFQILIPMWSDGVRLEDQEGETALTLYIFNLGMGSATIHMREVLEIFLCSGHFNTEDLAHEPIRLAAASPNIEMCRLLIMIGGVDPWILIDVDSKTGKPFSLLGPSHEGMKREAERLRRSVCSLMPLAVSTEYLV